MGDGCENSGWAGSQCVDLKIAAIGPATRQAIEQHGVKVDVVPREYVAESVVASLRRKVKGKRVLLARARVARDVIPRELRKLGARVDVVEAYETVIPRVFTATAACGAEISETVVPTGSRLPVLPQ